MLLIIGVVIVFGSVVGGYVMDHGQIMALWQPTELLIIGGASVGSFVTSNPPAVVSAALKGVAALMRGPQYKRHDYVDLLSLLFDLLIKVRKEGLMSLEEHVDNPGESPLFTTYPRLMKEHHLIDFMTDCLRLMVGGGMNPMELEQLLDTELGSHHSDGMAPAMALQKMADALPGFGIVAAVLGIVTTMSSIGSGDVATIGGHVAAALVGTFLGILLAYGLVGPLSAALEYRANDDSKPFEATKIALVASLRGYNPQVAIEFARKSLAVKVRPTFSDLEAHLKEQR